MCDNMTPGQEHGRSSEGLAGRGALVAASEKEHLQGFSTEDS